MFYVIVRTENLCFLQRTAEEDIVLVDIQEYERQQAILKLLSKLLEADAAIKTGDEWQSLDDLKRSLGV